MRRRPLLAAGLVAAATCSTLPLLGTSASAADAAPATRSLLVTVTDTDGDGGYGLYGRTPTGGATLVPESDSTDVYAATTSRDGSRIAYLQDVYDDAGNLTHERLVVRDTTLRGAPVFSRVVSDLTSASGDVFDESPVLSPDGSTVLWNRIDLSGTDVTFSTLSAPVATGTAVHVADDLFGATFLDAQTLLASSASGPVTLPATGGTETPVDGLTPADGDFTVSADGAHLAWTRDTTPDGSDTSTSELHAAELAVANGTPTLTGDRTLSSGTDAEGPAWSPDGTVVDFVGFDAVGQGTVWSAPSDASAAAGRDPLAPVGDTSSAAFASVESVAPGTVTLLPATVGATSATVRWTLPADTDVDSVVLTRGGESAKTVLVKAPATSYVDTGLKVGATYLYTAYVLDKSDNRSGTTSRQLTTLATTPATMQSTPPFPDPTSTRYYVNPSFRVYLPTGTYSLQYRTNGTGPLTTWLDHVSGTSQVFSTARAGSSYGLLLTRYDGYGNSTAPIGLGTAVVPYDQNRATYSGSYATQSLNERYLGGATILKAAGAAARLVVSGNRLQVIGEKCTSCGVMDVYVDGTRVAGVDTHDTQRRTRVVLYTRNLTAGVNHTVVVKARGTAGRPNVVLDAFGVRH